MMARSRSSWVLAAAGLVFMLTTSVRAATIVVTSVDGPGEGFNDPTPVAPVGGNPGTTLGAQRLNAFQAAANIWGSLLTSTVTIQVSAAFDPLPCTATDATLGQAAPHGYARDFANAPLPGTWYPAALANALSGVDLDPGNDDIDAQFNSDFGNGCAFPGSFYLGFDANPPGVNDSDLVTVVLHELGHGLGFLTLVDFGTGAKALGFNDTYMVNLEDHSTGVLWPAMSNAQRLTSITDTGDLHWVGANAMALGAFLQAGRDVVSGHIQMFAPSPVQGASSVDHFDTALSPDEVMEPAYTGANHNPGIAVGVLGDIGWGVTAPPSTTATTTTTSTTLPLPAIDGYACDKAGVNTSAGGVKLPKASLPTRTVVDEFGSDTCTIKKEERMCAPLLPALNAAITEVGYQVACPTAFAKTTINMQDGLVPNAPVTLLKRAGLLAPSGMIDLGPVPPAPPQTVPGAPPALVVDHYLCYKAKGPKFKPLLPVSVSDPLFPGGYAGAAIAKLARVCMPVDKAGEDPTAPTHDGHLNCYQMKLVGTKFTKTNVSTNNTNFGPQVMKVTGTAELCLPARRLP